MRVAVDQRFAASPAAVLRALTDPVYVARLGELPQVADPALLEQHRDGDRLTQRVRYRFAGDLPRAVTKVLDPARLVWVEETTYDLAASVGRFRIAPEHYADRLRCSGDVHLDADGGGTRRRVVADLVVRYPVVGGRVERAIASGLEEHLAAEVALVADHLAGAGGRDGSGPRHP